MSRQTPYVSEIVSLTVMLLMIVALVAGQADATLNAARAGDASTGIALTQPEPPATARVRANFEIHPLAISIDASAEVRKLIPDVR